MIILRQHQQNSVHWLNRQLNNSRHPLCVAPTGAGKSIMIGQLCQDRITLKNRLLIIVPQLEIHDQFMTHLTNIGLNPGYINDEGIVGLNRSIYVCMYQSLERLLDRLPEKFIRSFSEIIVDEAHHSNAQSFRNIFETFSHCQRTGFTATPYRTDNQSLGEHYTDMHESITMTEAIANGYLCKPIVIIPEEYRYHVPDVKEMVNINEQLQYIQEKKIIGNLPKIYKEVFNGLPVIVPCSSHEHAKQITEMMKEYGWHVDHIHSKMTKHERKKIVRNVKSGKINLLVTVGVGTEGMDIPGLFGIIWLRLTQSLTIYMQFNGRAMRPAPGKKYFIMVDCVGNTVLHGRPDIDRKWTLDTEYIPGQDNENETHMKICPSCGVMVSKDAPSCWICEYDFKTGLRNGEHIDKKTRKLPTMVDGNLVYLDKEESDVFCNTNNSCNDNNSNIESNSGNLKKAEKMKILAKDLTGVRTKNKFKECLKWIQ